MRLVRRHQVFHRDTPGVAGRVLDWASIDGVRHFKVQWADGSVDLHTAGQLIKGRAPQTHMDL